MKVAYWDKSDQFWLARPLLWVNMPDDSYEWEDEWEDAWEDAWAVWEDAWAVWCGCPL